MAVPEPLSRALARMAVALRLDDIPEAVLARARLHMLDCLGLGLAATREAFAASALAGVAALGQGGDCSVIGQARRFPARDAALLNAVLMHGLDFDDTHLASIIHPTCTSLPAALALAEQRDLGGDALLAAFLAGAETAIRIGLAVDGGLHHLGYHATGVVSHFASAITAGRLMGLDEDALVAAQGIAGSTAAGIQVFLEEGAWTKRFHPGWGAAAGITAAHLAQTRFKGPSRVYEGQFGLFATHLHTEAKLDAMTDGLGQVWRFGETALKPYPVCHFIHGCADAAIDLYPEIGGAAVVSVRALLPQPTLHIVAEPAEAKQRATTEYEAKFSAQHVVAAALLRGRFGLPDLLPEALADPAVRDLARRVTCAADPESRFPEYFSGGLEVTLADGRVLTRHVPVNSGAGARAMDEGQVVAKFMASASLAIEAARAESIAEAVLDLENRPARALAELLRPVGA
jgi:2-methylcitrate dehydratase PrpD